MTKKLMTSLVMGLVTLGLLGVPVHAATPTAAARIAECTNATLKASYRATDAGMGHRYGRIVLRNVSRRSCTVQGYGGLSYVGHGDGTQIGAAADRTRSRVPRVLLRPGQRVVSAVDATTAAPYPRKRCRPAHVDGFRVYLPDETRSQYVPHPTTGCRDHRIHLLAHRAYRRP